MLLCKDGGILRYAYGVHRILTMKGVVNSSDIAIKVDADDAKARLNELKDKLLEAFGFDDISQTKWDRKRDRFLESVLK